MAGHYLLQSWNETGKILVVPWRPTGSACPSHGCQAKQSLSGMQPLCPSTENGSHINWVPCSGVVGKNKEGSSRGCTDRAVMIINSILLMSCPRPGGKSFLPCFPPLITFPSFFNQESPSLAILSICFPLEYLRWLRCVMLDNCFNNKPRKDFWTL